MPERKGTDRDRGGRQLGREVERRPDLDEAGGISREELNPERGGARPVRQNDRTRDRPLEEPPLP